MIILSAMSDNMFNFWEKIVTDLLPQFLLSEPICYVFGGLLFLTIVVCFKRAIR